MRPETGGRSGAPAGSRAATAATPSPTATSRRCTSIPSGEGPENACALDSLPLLGATAPGSVSPEAVPLPSLLQEFASIPDHRRPQGRKFQLPTLLAIWELARLSGYRGVDATWRYACALNQRSCATRPWRHPGYRSHPPSSSHPASSPDRDRPGGSAGPQKPPAAFQYRAGDHDGKRLRGANRQGEAHYQTVSLVNHANAMPIATRAYTEQGGEIAAVLALLEEVDVRGSVITLDALHTTRNTALAIRHRHRAHYLFTVTGQRAGFQTLETIDWDRDASSHFCENDPEGSWPHPTAPDSGPETPSSDQLPVGPTGFRITRKRHRVKTGEASIEVTYGLTSLATGRRRAAVGSQPWPLGHREPEPPPPHDLRRRCLSDAHRPRAVQQRHRQPHGARHHLPSRLPPSPSRGSALCHGSGRSDPRGRRDRIKGVSGAVCLVSESTKLAPDLAILQLGPGRCRPIRAQTGPFAAGLDSMSMATNTASLLYLGQGSWRISLTPFLSHRPCLRPSHFLRGSC